MLYQQVELTNVAAPILTRITDDGVLITVDNWYSTGAGEVVAIYNADGTLLKSYQLTDLFPNRKQFEELPRSVSSINWRCLELDIDINYGYLYVPHVLGGSFRFKLDSGEMDEIQPERQCKK